VAGLNGELANGWNWDVYYQYGKTDYSQRQYNTRINDNFARAVDAVAGPGGTVVCRVNADANPANDDPACSPLNLFGQNNFSQAGKDYSFGTALQDTEISQHVVAASLSGDLVDLWAGPLAFATGAEYRKDRAFGTADPISIAQRFYTGPGAAIDGELDVKEGFLELGAPLLRDVPFARSLDINGAVRLTDYSSSGSVVTWKVGLTWEPADPVRLRATRSRDIRAPNIFELFGPQQTSYQTVLDPANARSTVLASTLLGGNPDLSPEIADTLTVGVVLSPDFWGLEGLRLSVDYYDIKLKDAITTLGSQAIVDLCFQGRTDLCPLVQRDPSGAIAAVIDTNQNLNQINTRGIDFELAYRLLLDGVSENLPGALSARLLATRALKLETLDSSGQAIDRVGQLAPPQSPATGGVPKWQGTFSLTYEGDPLTLSSQIRYISSGLRDNSLIGPGQQGYDPSLPNSVNINKVPAFAYVDLNAQYAILDDGAHMVELFAAVTNLLDTDPPNYLPFFMPTNPVLYDVLGRRYRVGVRFEF